MLLDKNMTQKKPRYEMHKYWGKKPSPHLRELIKKFSNEGDVLLDPFSGYGVFACEALIHGRKSIAHDLNPVATFIQTQLLSDCRNEKAVYEQGLKILATLTTEYGHWYETECPNCGNTAKILSTLRTKEGVPSKNKVQCNCSKTAIEYEITTAYSKQLLEKEKSSEVPEHPSSKIIRNGRISAFEGMTTDDFFDVRSLICHATLYKVITQVRDEEIKNLLLLAFTSNLANCSKLVPPIKSRGEMSAGAWMTGFYVGKTYIENNVFHYFLNRLKKVVSGKKDYCASLGNKYAKSVSFRELENSSASDLFYVIENGDTKKLSYPTSSVDYIFTDPPYGDTVPYFEQSVLWNTWLSNNDVDYDNELVISDSKERTKRFSQYESEIEECISEISRVLKVGKFFSITFHSLAGEEWSALTKACIKNGFEFVEADWLNQKTHAPRQLNRKTTVKGDLLITFRKSLKTSFSKLQGYELDLLILNKCKSILSRGPKDTNFMYVEILKLLFSEAIIFDNLNIIQVLSENFALSPSDNLWHLHYSPEASPTTNMDLANAV